MSAPNGYDAQGVWTSPPTFNRTKGDRNRKHHNKHHRKVRRSPCNRPAAAPANPVGSFDRVEGPRHARIRAKLRWDEVTKDTSGFRLSVRGYVVEVEYTANGTDYFQARRYDVPAKDDGDPGTKDHIIVKGLVKNLGYRWRVRANSSGKDGCKGTWCAWQVLGNPGADEPPAPAVVKIDAKGKHHRKIGVRWNATASADDDDLFDDRVNHFVVEISTSPTFATNYAKDRGVKGNHRNFVIEEADLGLIFYARVRSVSSDRDKSAWIPGTIAGNSDPGASASGVEAGDGDVHVGAIRKFAKSATPTGGWLKCVGTGYSTTTYADLFAEIGYTYGGAGATFNVPDLRRRHSFGAGDTGYALGSNEGDTEGNRNSTHLHASDATSTTPGSDGTGSGVDTDAAGTTPASDAFPEATHGHNKGTISAGQPSGTNSAAVGGANNAGAGHTHPISGDTGGGASHGHNHNHSSHGHSHGHGSHGHGHNHGGHGHGHQHDNRNRPHLALVFWIKT